MAGASTRWCLGLVLGLLMFPGAARGDEAELQQLRRRVAELEAENAALKARVAELEVNTRTLTEAKQQAEQRADEVVARQRQVEARQREHYLDVTYDAAADRTVLATPLTTLPMTHGASNRQWVALEASHAGKTPAEPVEAITMRVRTFGTGMLYRHAKHVTFVIDGQEYACPVTGYDQVTRRVIGPRSDRRIDDEFVTVKVPLDVAGRIGAARSVTGRIATARFELSRELLAAFAAMSRQLGHSP